MIVQNVSHLRKTDISFTVDRADALNAIKLINKIKPDIGIKEVVKNADIARISIVGVGMKSHPGVAGKMFEVLARHKINIEMISTSDISISCIVQKKFAQKAVRALHSKFGLTKR